MKAPNSIGLTAGVLMSLSTAAFATPVLTLEGTTTDPTGIDNLVVDGPAPALTTIRLGLGRNSSNGLIRKTNFFDADLTAR